MLCLNSLPQKLKVLHMKTMLLLAALIATGYCSYAQNAVPTADQQIKYALLAAPKDKKIAALFTAIRPINNSFF